MHLKRCLPVPPVPPCCVLFVCSDPENRAGSPRGRSAGTVLPAGGTWAALPRCHLLTVPSTSPVPALLRCLSWQELAIPAPCPPHLCLVPALGAFLAAGIPISACLHSLCCPTGLVDLGFCCSALGFVVTRQHCGHGMAPAALRCLVPRG